MLSKLFHRSVTLDYVLVLHGSITLFLDDNKKVVLRKNDFLVQRGTIHGWVNEGPEWARVFTCMLRKCTPYLFGK